MSADNFYLVRRHPGGGFACVMGFMSDTDETGEVVDPAATVQHQQFDTIGAAVAFGAGEYSEYGVSIHPECDSAESSAPGSADALTGICRTSALIMCSACRVREQRDGDEFLPCSPTCYQAAQRACEERTLAQNARAFDLAVIKHLMREEYTAGLDAAKSAVAGRVAPRIRAAAQLWSCDPDDCPLCDCNMEDEGRRHIHSIAARDEREVLDAIDALKENP